MTRHTVLRHPYGPSRCGESLPVPRVFSCRQLCRSLSFSCPSRAFVIWRPLYLKWRLLKEFDLYVLVVNEMRRASCVLLVLLLCQGAFAGDENIGGLGGRVCAFGDMNRDRYTDMIVQTDTYLKINLQGENGQFSESSRLHPINLGVSAPVSCVVGDFNGDSVPDIMVTTQSAEKDNQFDATVYVFKYNAFMPVKVAASYFDQ
uniref:VCBS repeat-containing protein n=1 Tax=Steinernema glaseri TaxID=37863 RepID=A0A1I7Y1P5_9BILA